jgi:hypothetical protein
MARKSLEKRNIRKLSRVGGGKTYSITIPIEIVREFGWQEGQKLIVEKYGNKKRIIIEDWKE